MYAKQPFCYEVYRMDTAKLVGGGMYRCIEEDDEGGWVKANEEWQVLAEDVPIHVDQIPLAQYERERGGQYVQEVGRIVTEQEVRRAFSA